MKLLIPYKKVGIMFLLFFFLGISMVNIFANSSSLEELKQERFLNKVLDEIGETYQVFFNYESELIKNVKVNFELVKGESLTQAVNRLLNQTNLKYELTSEKFIIIYKNDRRGKKKAKKIKRKIKQLNKLEQKEGLSIERNNSNNTIRSLNILESVLVQKEEKTITGTVKDIDGLPLIGATVRLKGGDIGTVTDFDGKFSISLPNDATSLIISYTGYKDLEVTISGLSKIDVVLNEGLILEEVIVVGYGTQRKSDVTTSVASIKGDALDNEATNNLAEALTGKLAGVQIRQTSGAPGSNISIRIRGASSITAGNNPLYVIDGVPISSEIGSLLSITSSRNNFQEQPINPLASLDMDDIESIEILKDASAAAIYGSRGANGVVLITTKSGKKGRPQVSYNNRFGVSNVLKKIAVLDAYGFAELHVEAKNNAYLDNVSDADINDDNETRIAKGGRSYRIPAELLPYLQGQQGLTNTDWQDEIFRNGFTQSHTLSVQGGGERNKYFTSFNYFDQEGIVTGSNLERFTGRFNLEGDLSDKIKYGIKLNPSRLNYDLVSSNGPTWNEGVIASALAQAPIFPVRNLDGSFHIGLLDWTFRERGLSSEFVANPVAIISELKDKMQITRLLGNSFLDVEIIPDLNYKISFGAETNDIRRDFYRPQSLETLFWLRFGPDAVSLSTNSVNWLIENTLNYTKNIEKHNLNLLAGYSAQKEDIKTTLATGQGFVNDLVQTINVAQNTNSETRQEQWSLLSYLFRAQYNFDHKYYLSAAVRRDGSSRFGRGNKWGNFPSVSAGWRISQEGFLKDISGLDDLKLRASFGVTGNFQIPNYGAIALIDQSNYITGDDNITGGLTQITSANDDLSWERTETFDVGVNLALFNNLISIEADYYNSNTSDLLLNVNVPQVSGFTTQLQNIGKVNNKGFEFTLGLQKHFGDLSWQSSINFSTNKNKVVELGPEGDPIFANSGRGQTFITEIGKPIGSYYGYVVEGIYQSSAEIETHLNANSGTSQAGDFRFADLNQDGQITVADRQIIGDYQPDFTYGFTTTFNYKNLDFNIALQGVQGNEVLNTLRHYIAIPQGGMNNLAINADRWVSASNPGNGNIPRANFLTTGNNTIISTYHVEDGSYLKIQNISLGYKLPKTTIERIGLQSLRLYVTAQNPFLFTNYSGYNPEVNSNPTNQLGQGEDFGTYPLAKTFSFGVNARF